MFISVSRQHSVLPIKHFDMRYFDICYFELSALNITLLRCTSQTVLRESNHKTRFSEENLHFGVKQSYSQLW